MRHGTMGVRWSADGRTMTCVTALAIGDYFVLNTALQIRVDVDLYCQPTKTSLRMVLFG